MREVKFTIDGHGEFACDADELSSYKTAKQLVRADESASPAFDVMERVFMGRDEEYVERLGGGISCMATLLGAALEAAQAKKSSPSSDARSGAGAK
nr:hypothetical protein [uncultured Olsenella sp.]